jgi:hypothetical protein
MKKQIALLAAIVATSSLSAFGQDWVLFSSATSIKEIWDESTTPGQGTIGDTSGLYDVTFLWAATGVSDPLANIGTQLAINSPANATPTGQVATNGVASTGAALSTISTMLGAGWSIANNISSGSGTAATGLAITTTGTSGKITGYNGSLAFELNGGTGVSDSLIQVVVIAWNASATLGSGAQTFANVADFGYTSTFNIAVGSSAADGNINGPFNSLAYNSFGVAPVPEPTTLALAGLGGLSMLFLRRRKA